MTPDRFRQLAMSLAGTVESSHMGHPDFRIKKRIFATLGSPDDSCAMVRVTPEQQGSLMAAAPGDFFPAAGRWGQQGCTHVRLKSAPASLVREALQWAHERIAGPARL